MQSKIIMTQNGCLITPYKKNQSRELERETSIFDEVYHKNIPQAGFIVPYDKGNAFVTYKKPIDQLKRLFPSYNIVDMKTSSPLKTSEFSLTGIESFKPAQVDVINQFNKTKKSKQSWFINLQTGEGKTILSTYISSILHFKTWILCFSTEILKQWVKTYHEKTDIDPNRVLIINSSKILVKIMSGKINPEDYDIFLCTPGLLTSFLNTTGDYSLLYDIFGVCGIGLLIVDEAHRNMANIVKICSITNVKYQLFLSADFTQGDYQKEVFFKKIFANVVLITAKENIVKSMKYTKICVVSYNSHPDEIEMMSIYNRYGFSETLYAQYQFKKGKILDVITHLMDGFYKTKNNYRTLILISTVAEVDIAYEHINEYLKSIHSDITIGRVHSGIPEDEREWVKSSAQIIISTYKSFSTGIDALDIKFVISTNQCDKVTDNQSAGRARPLSDGSEAMYLMLVDDGFSYCGKKLKKRLSYLYNTKSSRDTSFKYVYKE